mmetsp:Transcript_80084/g.248538  ORF Transcript_80084/g.248538 Transcript_80084/m.248538 type:complete len:187 (-) Transcript_80084:4-564(-)
MHPTGITCSVPRDSPGHAFTESVPLGKTAVSEDQVVTIIQRLGRSWAAVDHNPHTRSCVDFCDTLCQLLGAGPLPEHVRKVAADLRSPSNCPTACCGPNFCNGGAGGAGGTGTGADARGNRYELTVLRRQLDEATSQLQQAQRDLACERASHDDAIRQVVEMKRSVSGSPGRSPARSPSPVQVPGR